jgi:SAM-dependent methyltransferase
MSALLELLACPICRGELRLEQDELRCSGCGRGFPVTNGVPDLRTASEVSEPGVLARLQYAVLGHPRVYDFQQAHFGAKPVVERLVRELSSLHSATILDIGAGTGVVAELLPDDSSRYVWLDNDVQKLRGLVIRGVNGLATLGEADRLPFRDGAADLTLMVEVSHHIPDDALAACLAEAARVTGGTFLFIDATRGARIRSKLMWHADLGRHPRHAHTIVELLEPRFEVARVEHFRGVNHDHVLCACTPRRDARDVRAGAEATAESSGS